MTTEYINLLLMLMHKSRRIMREERKLLRNAKIGSEEALMHHNRMRLHGMRILRINTKLQTA